MPPPYNRKIKIPEKYNWDSLKGKTGADLETHYVKLLRELGKAEGILGQIFVKSQNKISEPSMLYKVIEMINKENWVMLGTDVKGEIYEGLLQKNAEDTKSGAAVSYDDVSVTHNSISTDTRGAIDLFELVEQQIASGLDIDPALLGRTYSTTETYAGVVYHAFISSLDNIRKLIKRALEKIYFMHLVMTGFPVKRVKVKFNPSKALKPKENIESEGIKIDNVLKKMNAGIIDIDTAARELGYEKAIGTPQNKQIGLSGKKYNLPPTPVNGGEGCCGNVSFVELGWTEEEEKSYQKLEDEFIKSMMDTYLNSVDDLIGQVTKIDIL